MHSTRTLTSRNSYWTNSPCVHIGSRKRKKACAWACVRAGERVNLNKSSQICEIQFTVHYQFRLFSPFSRITTIPRGAYTRYTTTAHFIILWRWNSLYVLCIIIRLAYAPPKSITIPSVCLPKPVKRWVRLIFFFIWCRRISVLNIRLVLRQPSSIWCPNEWMRAA